MDDPQPLPRTIVRGLEDALADTPVVCVLGPRQCGKTTLVRTLAPKRAFITLDDTVLLDAAVADPKAFIAALPAQVTSMKFSGRQVCCLRSRSPSMKIGSLADSS